MEPELTIGTFSSGIARRRHLPAAMGARVVLQRKRSDAGNLSGIAGWGLKDNTRTARQYADRHGLPYLTVEDGFIRSIGLGVNGAEPFGFIVDRSGIYYDATRPSDLEELVRNGPSTSGRIRGPSGRRDTPPAPPSGRSILSDPLRRQCPAPAEAR